MYHTAHSPNLGETWSEAVVEAYRYGYEYFSHGYEAVTKEYEKLLERENIDSPGVARAVVKEKMQVGQIVSTSEGSRALWKGIDLFFDNHMPEEVTRQYHREAAVAEELDVAFEAGAQDALFNQPCNPECVAHLRTMEPEI